MRKSNRFFSQPNNEKRKLSPPPQSFDQGYFGVEKIRDQYAMKESFDFRDPYDDSCGLWPTEEQLPGFRGTAAHFHQVRIVIQ
jgi:hypothetical protein